MRSKNKKPTTFEVVTLVVEAIAAIAALISAIKWWQATMGSESSPPQTGWHDYYITLEGELQVKKDTFPMILLCALLVLSNAFDSIYLRIALAANALVVLAGVMKTVTEYSNGKEN